MKFIDLRCFMLKRKATAYIKNWMDTKDKKCLGCSGCQTNRERHISSNDLRRKTYEELLEINFKQMPSAMDIFCRRSYSRQYDYGLCVFAFQKEKLFPEKL